MPSPVRMTTLTPASTVEPRPVESKLKNEDFSEVGSAATSWSRSVLAGATACLTLPGHPSSTVLRCGGEYESKDLYAVPVNVSVQDEPYQSNQAELPDLSKLAVTTASRSSIALPGDARIVSSVLLIDCPQYVNFFVRLRALDGTLLCLDLFLPRTAVPSCSGAQAVPAHGTILRLDPYHAYGFSRDKSLDAAAHFCPHNYAYAALEVRGSGCSDGRPLDEYCPAETMDGVFGVRWIASQPWCRSGVVMCGLSYSGFTALQVAKALGQDAANNQGDDDGKSRSGDSAQTRKLSTSGPRSPLKGVFVQYASDDRWMNDVHYLGGVKTCSEMLQYAFSMTPSNLMPPRPALLPSDWERMFAERLVCTEPWLFNWMTRQQDSPYWRHGSLAPDYGAIKCPVYHISGWNDAYCDSACRMHDALATSHPDADALSSEPQASIVSESADDDVPFSMTTVVGNWCHIEPSCAWPGPCFDENEALMAFLAHVFKVSPTGADGSLAVGPPAHPVHLGNFRAYLRTHAPPQRFPRTLPGQWFECHGVPQVRPVVLHSSKPGEVIPAITGSQAQFCWGAGSPPNGLATDMTADESKSWVAVYTPAEFTAARGVTASATSDPVCHMLGCVTVTLDVNYDRHLFPDPNAGVSSSAASTPQPWYLVARLFAVDEQGVSSLISTGIASRPSHSTVRCSICSVETSSPSEHPLSSTSAGDGHVHDWTVPMKVSLRAMAYTHDLSHSLKLTISTSYVPVLFASFNQHPIRWSRLHLSWPELIVRPSDRLFADSGRLPPPPDPNDEMAALQDSTFPTLEAEALPAQPALRCVSSADTLLCESVQPFDDTSPHDLVSCGPVPCPETKCVHSSRLRGREHFRLTADLRTFQSAVRTRNEYEQRYDGITCHADNLTEIFTVPVPVASAVTDVTRTIQAVLPTLAGTHVQPLTASDTKMATEQAFVIKCVSVIRFNGHQLAELERVDVVAPSQHVVVHNRKQLYINAQLRQQYPRLVATLEELQACASLNQRPIVN